MIRPPGSRREGPSRAPRVVAVSLSLVMAVACMSATAGPAGELAVQPRVVTEGDSPLFLPGKGDCPLF